MLPYALQEIYGIQWPVASKKKQNLRKKSVHAQGQHATGKLSMSFGAKEKPVYYGQIGIQEVVPCY